jgi:hypothetical protein
MRADGIWLNSQKVCVPIKGPGGYDTTVMVKPGQRLNLMWWVDNCGLPAHIPTLNNDSQVKGSTGGWQKYWVEISDSGPGRPGQ